MVTLNIPGRTGGSCCSVYLEMEKVHQETPSWDLRFRSGCGFNAVSTETVSGSATVGGRQVTVVDTPGFTGKVLRPKKLYLEIMKLIKEASPGPHAFVIVVKIDRISEAKVKLFGILPKLFGRDVDKYVMVLFTHGDKLKGQSIGDLCNENRYVKNLVEKCGGRICVLDNTNTGNRMQVNELLEKIDEMVTANGGVHYTSEKFRKAQTGMVNISIIWDEIREDFIRLISELDCLHCGYKRLD
ncbi:GTPase IMAP family member 1-like [Micropterus dolomieu]|uniref:GTPase IMAP family member 1-like n=1 Tax=Micropterus dolomieu TaxID=147949 RepID=UPI001E8EBE31|nr:GTPase IMAP family member 1-like [Micropterus dolomieu]